MTFLHRIEDHQSLITVMRIQELLSGVNKDNILSTYKVLDEEGLLVLKHVAISRNVIRFIKLRWKEHDSLFKLFKLIYENSNDQNQYRESMLENLIYNTKHEEYPICDFMYDYIELISPDNLPIRTPFSDDIYNILFNDDADELSKIIFDLNFDINTNVKTSIPEIENPQIIDLAAFLSAFKCFKILLLNGANINCKTIEAAIAGGSFDILQLIEQEEDLEFRKNKSKYFRVSIYYHQREVFDWLKELDQIIYVDEQKLDVPININIDKKLYNLIEEYKNNYMNSIRNEFIYGLRDIENCNMLKNAYNENNYCEYEIGFRYTYYITLHRKIYDVPSIIDSFYLACSHGFLELVEIFYENKAYYSEISGLLSSSLNAACYHGHFNVVHFLLKNCGHRLGDINSSSKVDGHEPTTPIVSAIKYGSLKIVDSILKC